MDYDLIVCGAGPAGATAAMTAAQSGLKVAVLEKYPLPRHKTCGGGIPMIVQEFLRDLVPEAFVESDVRYMRHTWNFKDPYLAAINPPNSTSQLSIWMVQRAIFDQALVEAAVRSGAEVRDGLAVRSLEVDGDRVVVRAQAFKQGDTSVRTPEFLATARYVICADGASGITAKAAGLRQHRAIALGMEVEQPYEWGTGAADLQPNTLHLEYGAIPKGYAWVFPKQDHLNVGAGVFQIHRVNTRELRHFAQSLKQAIVAYLNLLQVNYNPEHLTFYAHPLPTWNGKERLHTTDGRILLAGDAAGLINPFFGDGILHAVKSGKMAATCVAEGSVQEYSNHIHQEFASNFDTARRLAHLFYLLPQLCYRYGVKHEKATYLAARLLCGNLQFNDILGKALRHMCTSALKKFS